MKQQQADLERLLAKERAAIRVKHDERVKVAQAKLVISYHSIANVRMLTRKSSGPRYSERACRNTKQTWSYFLLQMLMYLFIGWWTAEQMMADAYKKDLHRFDAERVLVAWDGLVVKQQAALENLRVPTMFVTSDKANRQVCNLWLLYQVIHLLICLVRITEAAKGRPSSWRHCRERRYMKMGDLISPLPIAFRLMLYNGLCCQSGSLSFNVGHYLTAGKFPCCDSPGV